MIRQLCLAALFGTALFATAVLVRVGEPRVAPCGLMLKLHNQYQPFEFHGVADAPVFYSMLRSLSAQSERQGASRRYYKPSDTGGERHSAHPFLERR
jgi:hypothetical protein